VATTAREDERRRCAGTCTTVSARCSQASCLRWTRCGWQRDRDKLMAHLEEQARTVIGEVRRISRHLGPTAMETGEGLDHALGSEAQRLRTASLNVQLRCSLDDAQLPAAVEVAVLRIVAEALTNVVRHSGAASASVEVLAANGVVAVTVVDDGNGFKVDPVPGVGTASMRTSIIDQMVETASRLVSG
jgi:two-component system, NarL family, sensor kinase